MLQSAPKVKLKTLWMKLNSKSSEKKEAYTEYNEYL